MDIKGLPKETQKSFQICLKYIQGYGDTVEKLSKKIVEFRARLETVQKTQEFIDSESAKELILISMALLELCKESAGSPFVPFALAAVAYLVEAEDGHPDFANADGFDDDKEVISAVIDYFQLSESLKKYISQGRTQ